MAKRIAYFSLAIWILFYANDSFSQTVPKYQLEVAYIYSFAKNIQWPANSSSDFRVLVISTNEDLIAEFDKLSDTRKLGIKKIKSTSSASTIVGGTYDLIFVSSEYNQAIRSIYDQIRDTPTLLITDGFRDNTYIMINFIEEKDQTLGFELNQANIINQGLEVLPDMVLLGGTTVDVAKLYRSAQDSVRDMEIRINSLQGRYDSIFERISQSDKIIAEQAFQINKQTNEITEKQLTIDRQNESLDTLRLAVQQSSSQLDSISNMLNNKEAQLSNLQTSIDAQSIQLEEGNERLADQEKRLQSQLQEIEQRESNIEELGDVVDVQRNALFWLLGFSALVLVLSLLIYRAYRLRKRDAMILSKQKEELSTLLQELRETQSQLVAAEKMASLGVLTAGIAHEINNAINFVYSGIFVIDTRMTDIKPVIDKIAVLNTDSKNLTEEVEEIISIRDEVSYAEAQEVISKMIENVQVGAKRTTEIVNGLRTFSKEEEEVKSEIDIHSDLDVALLLLQNRYKNNIEIVKKYDNKVPGIIGYQGQLGQAFLNIISNAIDAIYQKQETGNIEISTFLKGEKVLVEIKDDGIGIDGDIEDKIFDPFFSTKKVGDGTGLGLSITYGIIERHGGTIKVISDKSSWTVFSIELPLEAET